MDLSASEKPEAGRRKSRFRIYFWLLTPGSWLLLLSPGVKIASSPFDFAQIAIGLARREPTLIVPVFVTVEGKEKRWM